MRLGAVMGLPPLAPVAYQAGELQNGEVFGHCGLRDAGMSGQHAHRLLTAAREPFEDGAAGRIGEGFKNRVWCAVHKIP